MSVQKMTIDIKGKGVEVDSVRVGDVVVVLIEGFLRQALIHDEWYTDVDDPASIIETLKKISPRPDLFTFFQHVPHVEPRYPYYWEPQGCAVLPVTTFDNWWNNHQIKSARNHIRNAEKKGVILKRPEFDDAFVQGMVEIFNETPVRQGRPYWHYGKDFEAVKKEFSKFLFRESLIGAYYKDELIGFIMLGYAGNYVELSQIVSKIEHRDKSPTNALLAEAVRVCEEESIPYLLYGDWDERGLGSFKKNNGFECFDVPRYYVPLTTKGKLALSLKLHRGIKNIIPENIRNRLKDLRNRYYIWKAD
jgi:hypothetical protein